jgi:hypothetical protein
LILLKILLIPTFLLLNYQALEKRLYSSLNNNVSSSAIVASDVAENIENDTHIPLAKSNVLKRMYGGVHGRGIIDTVVTLHFVTDYG